MPAIDEDELLGDPKDFSTGTIGEDVKYTEPYVLGTTNFTSKNLQENNIIRYLRGYQWKVDYFNNLAGVNDNVTPGSDKLDKSIQKYNKFEDLIIYMDNPFTPGDTSELEASGVINIDMIPFIGDHFIATMIDNRKAIFIITEVKSKTYQSHTVYQVGFKLHQFTESDDKLAKDLEDKVVNEYAYDINSIGTQSSPMLLKSDVKKKLDFQYTRERLINTYFNMYTDRETLYLNPFGRDPNKDCRKLLVDPLLNKFINKTINVFNYEYRDKLKDFDSVQSYMLNKSILDCLIEQDNDYLFTAQSDIGWTMIKVTLATPASRNLYWLGVNGVVDILTPDNNLKTLINQEALFKRRETPNGLEVDYPLLLEEDKLDYYIFDKYFYEEDLSKLTKFQHIVKRFLNGEIISTDELEIYVNEWRYWSRYEQYYIIPILILLMKYCTMQTFKEK